jgi:ABC-type lipoprotein export system ATPase subunit
LPELATLRGVTKEYVTASGVVVALNHVDATIRRGAVTALVGVSGSGKSTLLRLLAALERPTGGALQVDGLDLATADADAIRRFRGTAVSYVSQRAADNLVPHLRVADHLPDGADTKELLGLEHRLQARPSQLSGGERARASFAVALSRQGSIVLADEPTAELDTGTAAAVLQAIQAAAARGLSVVIATHDPAVVAIADDVIELERGRNRTAPARPAPSARTRSHGQVVLRASNLSKAYGTALALDDASLEVRAHELAVVVGRSGSGKSTLLMILGGWQTPDEGSAPIDTSWSNLGFLPQRFGLLPELTVRENVDLPARIAGREGATDELLESLALDELADRQPTEISVGQQQRVALARALCLRPPILLVDEPTSHQDAASAERVWACLADATARGAACLVATHEPDAAARANVAWTIEDGRLR